MHNHDLCTWMLNLPFFYLLYFKNTFAYFIVNIYQGINDNNENTIPTIPAVEGTVINTAAIRPKIAVDLL